MQEKEPQLAPEWLSRNSTSFSSSPRLFNSEDSEEPHTRGFGRGRGKRPPPSTSPRVTTRSKSGPVPNLKLELKRKEEPPRPRVPGPNLAQQRTQSAPSGLQASNSAKLSSGILLPKRHNSEPQKRGTKSPQLKPAGPSSSRLDFFQQLAAKEEKPPIPDRDEEERFLRELGWVPEEEESVPELTPEEYADTIVPLSKQKTHLTTSELVLSIERWQLARQTESTDTLHNSTPN